MSQEYNPETDIIERIGTLEKEARELARKRDAAGDAKDRQTLDGQLKEVEEQIRRLKRRLQARV